MAYGCNIIVRQRKKYPIEDIPSNLLEHSDMVIRESQFVLTLRSKKDVACRYHFVYSIMNKSAKDYLALRIGYNRRINVSDIKYVVYNKTGEEIAQVKKSEIRDFSTISGASIFEDSRLKYIYPGEFDYPITIECSYEIDYNGFLDYPDWSPVKGYNVAVESSTFEVKVDTDASFRYLEFNSDSLTMTYDPEARYYKWEISNFPAFEYEAYSTAKRNFIPMVYTAPEQFKIEGYDGNLETWNEFGNWILDLNEGRDELNGETVAKLKELTATAKTDFEKAKILYKYMQDNSRYVSIQIGIGGWQPMFADDVDRLAYGDCKALSNYMKSILKAVGIESYYALVRAGADADPILADFPSQQFNHAILCVPNNADTIWLECTSQNSPFGYLGQFTDNRNVLLVKPEGGKLVKTTKYTIEDNTIVTNAIVDLNPTGYSIAEVEEAFNGLAYDYLRSLLVGDDDDKKKKMYNNIDLPGFVIKSFSHEVKDDRIPAIYETMELELQNFCINMGNRSFFNPNLLSRKRDDLRKYSNRISDIEIARSYAHIDTITYNIPEEYELMGVKDPIEIVSDFGIYRAEFNVIDKQLQYVRRCEIYEGVYPKENYLDFVDFYEQIVKADNTKLAVKKN